MQKWGAWIQQLRARMGTSRPASRWRTAERWSAGRRRPSPDGPYAEAKDLVGGFLLIEAPSLDAATELLARLSDPRCGRHGGDPPDRLDERVNPDLDFRRESARMLAALARVLGFRNLAMAEDVVQDVLCRALEIWKYSGPPARCFGVADHRRAKSRDRSHPPRADPPRIRARPGAAQRIRARAHRLVAVQGQRDRGRPPADDVLGLCAQPARAGAARRWCSKLLCGFGTREIAAALLSSEAAVEKLPGARKGSAGARRRAVRGRRAGADRASAWRRCSMRSTCSSPRGTTAAASRFRRSFAPRRCGCAGCSRNIPPAPRHALWLSSP